MLFYLIFKETMMKHQHLIAILLTAYAASPLLAQAADADHDMTPTEAPIGSYSNGANGVNEKASSADVVDDATITKNVKQVLSRNAYVSKQKVDVDTQDGVVTLSGKVNDQQHTSAIIRLASQVKGVKKVNNQIQMGNS
jgi:osmotically-inducible protein OsmY